MNLPQIAPLKNPVCQIKLNTQLIKCIPRLPQSFCVNQNRWLMSNLDTEKKQKQNTLHMRLSFFFAVFDHLASRDWENELSWNTVACMICLFTGRRLWPLCEHDLSLLGMCQADNVCCASPLFSENTMEISQLLPLSEGRSSLLFNTLYVTWRQMNDISC